MTRLLIVLISLHLFACEGSEQDLGNGYYWLPKYESIDIGYPNDAAIVYKSDERLFFKDIKINGDVVEVNSDNKHIVAKRKPKDSDIDSVEFEYYIIVKELDRIVGPLDFKTLLEVKKKLDVEISL